jgi:predicted metal-dependent hydrolase
MSDGLPDGLRADLRAGAVLFAAGEWWEAHEAWELPWKDATGDERQFIQALILLAAALHKRWHHGSLTHRNFHKAGRYLDALPDTYGGVDLARLRADVWTALHDPARRPRLFAPGGAGLE